MSSNDIEQLLKSEFLNRMDGVVIFNQLTARDINEIARLQLNQVRMRLAENNILLEVNEDVVFYFAEKGYDPVFGARPLRRLIE